MPSKSKLEQLKGNVTAQEARLEEAMKILNEAKNNNNKNEVIPNTSGDQTQNSGEYNNNRSNNLISEWDALERVIGLMDDLLTSYRNYSKELEKKARLPSSSSSVHSKEKKSATTTV